MPESNPRQDENLDFLDDRYDRISRIGSGAMGVVYKAFDTVLKKWVAIKLLNASGDSDEHVVRFQREAKAASKIKHENIVTIMDFGVNDSRQFYMIMDYIEGKPLSDIIKEEGRLEEERVILYGIQICDALSSAHANGVIHRDLKPGNIIVTADDTVYIVDFGIAKMQSDDPEVAKLTQSGMILGTPAYMSPEQIRSEEVTANTDLYSLGCVMFECLAGEKPFSGNTILDTMHKHETENVPTLKEKCGVDYTQEMEETIAKLLAKDPAERFQSAEELAESLQACLDSIEETGYLSQGSESSQALDIQPKAVTKSGVTVFLAVVCLVLTVMAGIWLLAGDKVEKATSDKKQDSEAFSDLKPPPARAPIVIPEKDGLVCEGFIESDALKSALKEALRKNAGTIAFLKVEDCKEIGDSLEILKDRQIIYLSLTDSTVAKNFFDVVKRLDSLKSLSLDTVSKVDRTNISADDISKLSSLKYLNKVELKNIQNLPDEVFEALARLPHLEVLALERTSGFSNDALGALKPSKTFRNLVLGNRTYGTEFWKVVGDLDNMHKLTLERVNEQELETALTMLKNAKNLEYLALNNCSITDETMKKLSKLFRLNQIVINQGYGLTSRGVKHLNDLPHLKELQLRNGAYTRSALLEFSKLNKVEDIFLVGYPPKYIVEELQANKKNFHIERRIKKPVPAKENPFSRKHGKVYVNVTVIQPDNDFPWLLKMKNPVPKKLEFARSNVRGPGFQYIYGLPLTNVMLNETAISDKTLVYLTYFPDIQNLDFKFTKITDKGLSYLVDLKKLKILDITSCKFVTDSGFKRLVSDCPGIEILKISFTKLTPECYSYLPKLKKLRTFVAEGLEFKDEYVEKLLDNNCLTNIGLNHCASLTDSGFLKLAKLKSLEEIGIGDTNLSKDAIEKFHQLRPEVRIQDNSKTKDERKLIEDYYYKEKTKID